ncbi:MAG: hypothetical protein ACK4K0_05195 [Flavobacteriales bacterium]
MNSELSTIWKYVFPGGLTLVGLILFIIGFTGGASGIEQTLGFKLGGLALLLMGVISLLFVEGIISRSIHNILSVVLFVGCLYLIYLNWVSVQDHIDKKDRFDLVNRHIKQRLADIRDIQVKYKEMNRVYAGDWNTLIDFAKNGKVMDIIQEGIEPDRLTREQADALGYKDIPEFVTPQDAWRLAQMGMLPGYKRDTVYNPLMSKLFDPSDERYEKRVHPINLDSLPYVPFSPNKLTFVLKSDTLQGGIPVFLVKDPAPFNPFNLKLDTLQVGSLSEPKTSGNWKE